MKSNLVLFSWQYFHFVLYEFETLRLENIFAPLAYADSLDTRIYNLWLKGDVEYNAQMNNFRK